MIAPVERVWKDRSPRVGTPASWPAPSWYADHILALIAAVRHGSQVLVIVRLSGRAAPWWPAWSSAFATCGGRADAWSLELDPPVLTLRLGLAAGLTPTTAKLRTIYASPADPVE